MQEHCILTTAILPSYKGSGYTAMRGITLIDRNEFEGFSVLQSAVGRRL